MRLPDPKEILEGKGFENNDEQCDFQRKLQFLFLFIVMQQMFEDNSFKKSKKFGLNLRNN